MWGAVGEERNFLFCFHVEILGSFTFRSILLNGGTFSLYTNCNSGSVAFVRKKDLAFSNLNKDTSVPRSGM